jgi:hypothetical protein
MLSRLLKRVHTPIFGFLLIFSDLFSILIVLYFKFAVWIVMIVPVLTYKFGATNVISSCIIWISEVEDFQQFVIFGI